ncbi:MAG: phospho-sugar mutase, partial [Oscillospiraceae bacterium]|nr:phospho-sugar mutase [Oscillospiraceae bacterium]
MDFKQRYEYWKAHATQDPKLVDELEEIREDSPAIEDRFYRDLEFGTGGLRGVLGAGTNRMNVYTVGKATQGYSNYLLAQSQHPSVAIAYDSRINSEKFACTAAEVFSANGIAVHLYSHLMPTPALSFAVRDLHCTGGIVITASHNPAKYNGYKVYGRDGCQITTEAAAAIQSAINGVDAFSDVKRQPLSQGLDKGQISYIGEDTAQRYLQAVGTASVLPTGIEKDISIVYTPLNGAGISCVLRCLEAHGFTHVTIPPEQGSPDGNFPTCPYPNPEERSSLEVGIRYAVETGSDLLLATDPDCDRVGVAVKQGDGYTLISGNEMGILLLNFICKMRTEQGTMPRHPVAVKTIVTTPMAEKIAAHYGVELRNVLTGFKFIGEQIGLLEQEGQAHRYIFGFEESYGYLSGSFVRDKDAVNASLLICEMFAYYKAQGKTLLDVLEELSRGYGYYQTRLISFAFEGSQGFEMMQKIMAQLRRTPPALIAGNEVVSTKDYLSENTGLPKSNVLVFGLSQSQVVVRPSGTEPKLKMYLTACADTKEGGLAALDGLDAFLRRYVGACSHR